MSEIDWSPTDRQDLAARGIPPAEAERQLRLIERPTRYARLDRACTVDDGILRLADDRAGRLVALHGAATAAGRFRKFVPASGAASRMFRDLLHWTRGEGHGATWNDILAAADRGESRAEAVRRLMREIDSFAFRDDLDAELRRRGEDLAGLVATGAHRLVLDALLEDDGLDYANLPKGVLPFHATPAGGRTPFEEHLVEGADHVRDDDGVCRLHFTISPEHRDRFDALLERVRPHYESRHDARFEVSFSVQKLSTDTIAGAPGGGPFRDAAGRLVFRPGGHGALIENLGDLGGDLVYVKNIDNVQPDRLKSESLRFKRVLGGLLVELQDAAFEHLSRLRGGADGDALDAAERFLRDELQAPVSRCADAGRRRDTLVDRLDRPLRVCGVVRNTGEPGGGPFWVLGEDGVATPQIVEAAQIDPDDARQQAVLGSATHFNPVDLVCGLRDAGGRSHELARYVDQDAVMVSTKSADGRDLRALERPGLWNGAMAGWNTVFVEVPLATFSPVKTVLDLLRDEHR